MNYIINMIIYSIEIMVILLIITLIILGIKYIIRKNEIKKLNCIECSNFNNEISIDDEKIRKILIYEVNKIKDNLQRMYLKNDWDSKRFLYEIIKDLATIKCNLEYNWLNEDDIYKINIIIEVLKLDSNINRICEKIIFEWEKILNK